MNCKSRSLRLGALVASAVPSTSAGASVEVNLDDFRISRGNGTVIFNDTFDDGAPPPAAPDLVFTGPASYTVLSSYAGSETPTSAPARGAVLRTLPSAMRRRAASSTAA